jgi:hypothetical protein
MAGKHDRIEIEIAKARQRFEVAWAKVQGRSDRGRRYRDPDAGLEPVPVGPTNPNNLSGGAEAPLDP